MIDRLPTTRVQAAGRAARAMAAFALAIAFVGALRSLMPEGSKLAAKPVRQIEGASSPARHAEEERRRELTTRFGQGVAMMQIGEYRHAITAFHRVLELEPRMPEAHVNMGFAFFELEDPAGALRFFDGALALAPTQANAHYGRALALKALGREAESATAMRRYLETSAADDPFREPAKRVLAELAGEQSRRRAPDEATRRSGMKGE